MDGRESVVADRRFVGARRNTRVVVVSERRTINDTVRTNGAHNLARRCVPRKADSMPWKRTRRL